MLPDPAGIEPATSWSPVGHASNWATEAGNNRTIDLLITSWTRIQLSQQGGQQQDNWPPDHQSDMHPTELPRRATTGQLTSWSPVGHTSNWATEAGNNRTIDLLITSRTHIQLSQRGGQQQDNWHPDHQSDTHPTEPPRRATTGQLTSWSPVRHASNWATEAGNNRTIHLLITSRTRIQLSQRGGQQQDNWPPDHQSDMHPTEPPRWATTGQLTSWSPVGHASNWATEAGNNRTSMLWS